MLRYKLIINFWAGPREELEEEVEEKVEEEKVVGELGEEEMEIKEVAAVGVGGVKIIRIITTSQGLVKPFF